MKLPMKMLFTSSTPVDLSQSEGSLYGQLDRVRQMTNASIRRFVDQHREMLVGRVLDFGAGKPGTCRIPQPFREMICAAGTTAYHPWEPDDPEPCGVFDAILCTQVIQGVENPFETFAKFREWLKPGGHLVLTWPICWEPIEQEYWRFTPKGIWLLCHKAGLKVIECDELAVTSLDGSLHNPLVGGAVIRA